MSGTDNLQAWLEGVKVREARASRMVSALCQPRGTAGSREWIMSIPARPDYDPDLVIGVSLSDLRTLVRKVEDLAEALQGLMDEQEGPPSPKRREQWEAAMAEARKALRAPGGGES